MGVPIQLVAGILILFLTSVPAAAQAVAGAAVEGDVHRFSGDPELNRLDGLAAGWLVTGGIRPGRHLALRFEVSASGMIRNTQTLPVDIDGRSVTVTSTLTHRVRSATALAGYTHEVSPRMRLTYLAGAAFMHADRTFSTDASGLILVPPSTSGTANGIVSYVDDDVGFAAGMDLTARVHGPLAVITGVRAQALHLHTDLSGVSIRPFAGAAWIF